MASLTVLRRSTRIRRQPIRYEPVEEVEDDYSDFSDDSAFDTSDVDSDCSLSQHSSSDDSYHPDEVMPGKGSISEATSSGEETDQDDTCSSGSTSSWSSDSEESVSS